MSLAKKDFYGKEVTEAIRQACETLKVPQEQLEIEVVETGSTGIFGLIRKKAHIRARVQSDAGETVEEIVKVDSVRPKKKVVKKSRSSEGRKKEQEPAEKKAQPAKVEDVKKPAVKKEQAKAPEIKKEQEVVEEVTNASQESLDLLEKEILTIVELMGYPSTLTIEAKGLAVQCVLSGEFEENLTGPEGKTLDSLQYLVRKIVTRKVPERLKVTIDVGNFREKRQEELVAKAVELAAMVKEDGKTQVIPALNPSERRVIHMILQDDKEIRSRSVGDGLFKKILIFKPGKGNKNNRKRPPSRGRREKAKK